MVESVGRVHRTSDRYLGSDDFDLKNNQKYANTCILHTFIIKRKIDNTPYTLICEPLKYFVNSSTSFSIND